MKRAGGKREIAFDPSIRCYLFYGPDEANSRALADRVLADVGQEVERVDLTPAQLKAEPALLSDEAASRSLFGGARCIRVDGAGDESMAAVELLLGSSVAGDPVILVAGALRKDARLVKLLDGSGSALVQVSYVPEARELARLASDESTARGLRLNSDAARRLAVGCGGDRAILAQEIAKLADYADASPETPVTITDEMLDAVSADSASPEVTPVLDALFSGNAKALDACLDAVARGTANGVSLVRNVQRRLLAMTAARAEMDRGSAARDAVERSARTLFWRDRETVARDLPRWPAYRLAAALDRCAALELSLKSSRGAGPIAADHFYHALARSVRR